MEKLINNDLVLISSDNKSDNETDGDESRD